MALTRITLANLFLANSSVEVYYKDPLNGNVYIQTVTANRLGIVIVEVPYANGEAFILKGVDNNGRPVESTQIIADKTPPNQPTDLLISPDGSQATGKAQPNSTIEVKTPTGQPLGSATANPDGSFTVTLTPPQKNGETVQVTASDPGGYSPPGIVVAPDITPPNPPTDVKVSGDGTTVTGKAQPGSTVEITGPGAVFLGTATALPDGSFTVTLLTPQKNAETLKATASDAGGTSDPTLAIAPDLTPPDAPTNVVVSADGAVVTGEAQPGSTVEIKTPAGISLGTTIAKPDGSFEVTLNAVQKNAETVNATATDAGGTSKPTAAVAPDLTPPNAPTDVKVSGDGTIVTGKAQPGSTVEITGPTGLHLGTTTAQPDGSFSVTLLTPQKNGEVIDATATDAGGTSPETSAIAPDITPPPLSNIAFTPDGKFVTGSSEPNVDIEIKYNGQVIGTGKTDPNGNFSVDLGKPYGAAENVTVIATDAAKNPAYGSATAPILLKANDDVVRADVDLANTVVTSKYSESKFFGSLGKFLGIPLLGKGAAEINFNVGETQKTGVDIAATNFGAKSLFDGVRVTLYKQDANGSWSKIASNTDVGLFNKFFLFFPEQARIKTASDLTQGNYKIIAEDLTLFSFLSKNVLNVTYTTETKSAGLEVQKANVATGNILSDDVTTAGTVVSNLTNSDGTSVNVNGSATLVGKYGTMVLNADGSYSYTPFKDVKVVGQVDEFTYTIKDAAGNTSTAKVYVQIGSDEVKLDWNPNDPSQAAKTLSLFNDVDTVHVDVYRNTKTTTDNVNSGELALTRNGSSAVTSSVFTIGQNSESTINVSIKAAYDQANYFGTRHATYQDADDTTFNWQLQKLNPATGQWENVANASGSQYFNQYTHSAYTGCTILSATIDNVTAPGQYRVNFTSKTGSQNWNYGAQEFDTDVTVTTKQVTDSWSQATTGSTSGNIFSGVGTDTAKVDSLGLLGHKLSISVDGGKTFVDVSASGTAVQGTSGKLVINSKGDYSYVQTNGAPVEDTFVYKITTNTGEVATATLNIGFESTIHGTQYADSVVSGAIQHVLELGAGADTVKFTAFNQFDDRADIWSDFSKAEGDKLDVSALLSGSGANAGNIKDYLSVVQDGNATVVKIDVDGKGGQHVAQDLVILENNKLSVDDLLQGNVILY